MRILLVEDERKVASFIARALRENTYAVDVAESGQKALELGADVSYDAILLDVRLPDLSGIEVCRELRQRGIESPVMMLTARGLVEQRVEGLDAGADDYLTKPFVLAELLARVRALVPQKQMADRKSTRLNSSHDQISYAVFCLKKKKKTQRSTYLPNIQRHAHTDYGSNRTHTLNASHLTLTHPVRHALLLPPPCRPPPLRSVSL